MAYHSPEEFRIPLFKRDKQKTYNNSGDNQGYGSGNDQNQNNQNNNSPELPYNSS